MESVGGNPVERKTVILLSRTILDRSNSAKYDLIQSLGTNGCWIVCSFEGRWSCINIQTPHMEFGTQRQSLGELHLIRISSPQPIERKDLMDLDQRC